MVAVDSSSAYPIASLARASRWNDFSMRVSGVFSTTASDWSVVCSRTSSESAGSRPG